MKTSIVTEHDLSNHGEKLPVGNTFVHFKMVGVGPNTLEKAEHTGWKICDVVNAQPGFFLMSQDGSGLREAMHDLVDRFCDASEAE